MGDLLRDGGGADEDLAIALENFQQAAGGLGCWLLSTQFFGEVSNRPVNKRFPGFSADEKPFGFKGCQVVLRRLVGNSVGSLMADDCVSRERMLQRVFQQCELPMVEIAVRSQMLPQSFHLSLLAADVFLE
ncbi:MAG: hypothetical protein WEB53_13495 [Akkermansiaceae bacterium]